MYVRLSLHKPRPGQFDAVKELQEGVLEALKASKGCRQAHLLRPLDDSGEIGRLSLWDSEEAAEEAAQGQHTMALRSQIGLLVEGVGTERAFETQA